MRAFRFQQAGREEEPGLRRLLAELPMPGPVRLAYTREPEFFQGLALEGPFTQALAALRDGQVVGMATRAVRPCYVNGLPEDLGYLGGLRVHPRVQGHLGLSRGYRLLKDLHRDGRCRGYLSTILEANAAARALLTSGRAGLPAYRPLGSLAGRLLLADRRLRQTPAGVRRAGPGDLDALLDFLRRHGPERQFFPLLRREDFGQPWLRGLEATDFWILEREGCLAGTLAAWDQRASRQLRVASYAPGMSILRPALNLALRLRGFASLPPRGEDVPVAFGCFLCVPGEGPADLEILLAAVLGDLSRRGYLGLAVVLHERDPLRPALDRFPALKSDSRLYGVGWADSDPFFQGLDPSRVPYVDAATL